MALQLDPYSRLKTTETIFQDGEEVWGTWNIPEFLKKPQSEVPHKIIRIPHDKEGRPDLISLEHYSTTLMDWVIIAFNNANGVFNWPRSGDLVKIPLTEVIISEVL